jgi:hypothetical protein
MRVLGLASSDRQRDLPDQTGENEQSAQAVAVALVRQKEAAEADQCGEGHGDLTSSVHVPFPQHFPPMTLARNDRFRSLREAFVAGGMIVGEKQEQSKNKIGLPAKIHSRNGRGSPPDHRPRALPRQSAGSCLSPLFRRALRRSGETRASEALFTVPDCFAPSRRRAGFFDALHRQSGASPLDPELDVGVGVAPAIGGLDLGQF